MRHRTVERAQFLADVLTGALEHAGYGVFRLHSHAFFTTGTTEELPPGKQWAMITDPFSVEDGQTPERVRVDIDTIAKGIGVVNRAILAIDDRHPDDSEVLHNHATGKRLFMSEHHRYRIMQANRENDATDMDVVDCLAILECALYGAVTYA